MGSQFLVNLKHKRRNLKHEKRKTKQTKKSVAQMVSYQNHPRSLKQGRLSGGKWPGSSSSLVAGNVCIQDCHL